MRTLTVLMFRGLQVDINYVKFVRYIFLMETTLKVRAARQHGPGLCSGSGGFLRPMTGNCVFL